MFDPLFELEDEEIDKISLINLDNKLEAKYFIEKYVVENFNKYGPESKRVCQNTLNYLLCIPENSIKIEDILPYGELPFKKPQNIKQLINLLLEIVFQNGFLENCNMNDFVIINDYNEPNSVYIK